MTLLTFLVTTNPNDATGGGGSLAGEMHDADAKGPFFVWPAQEFESAVSPHAVVAASEVDEMARQLAEYRAGGEALSGGEDMSHTGDTKAPVLVPDDTPDPEVFDLESPEDFRRAFGGE